MKLRFALIVLFVALTGCAVAARATSAPPAGVIATVNGLVAACNADNASRVNSYFTPNAWLSDEVPPFTWSGANPGLRWWDSVDVANMQGHITNLHASVGSIKFWSVNGSSAYVVVPLTITVHTGSRVGHENGLWALTLANGGGSWKVTSASWATLARS